jgi:hypothetical protein
MLWVTTNNGANYTLQEDESINQPIKGMKIHPKLPSTLVILVSGVYDQVSFRAHEYFGRSEVIGFTGRQFSCGFCPRGFYQFFRARNNYFF